MTQHMIAYASSVLSAGTLSAITPVPDNTVTISNGDTFVPAKYNMVALAAALVKANTITRAQLRTPSLREMWYPEVTPQDVDTSFNGNEPYSNWFENPIQLVTNEGLNFFSDGGGDGTTPADCYGIVVLSDSKVSQATGKMYSIVAKSSISLVARTWVDGPITFDQTLPVGNYDIVGIRAEGVGMVAARLIFIGASAVTRPGVIAVSNSNKMSLTGARYGKQGIFGTFNSITPPSIECLGDTGTAQTFVFDLIKRS